MPGLRKMIHGFMGSLKKMQFLSSSAMSFESSALVLQGIVDSLLKEPAKISEVLPSLKLLDFTYDDEVQKNAIQEAVLLWSLADPDSDLYKQILSQERFSCLDGFKKKDLRKNAAVDVGEKLANIFVSTNNECVKIVCILQFLPDDVFRQWLWYYNVDFQGKEDFLRRLTDEQSSLLHDHWCKLNDENVDMYDLPCFTVGWINKVYKALGLPRDFADKMLPKAAIAFNFPGGIGFKLYPNRDNDQQADRRMAMQFHDGKGYFDYFMSAFTFKSLKEVAPRGEFVINKESGLFWLMFKTMFRTFNWTKEPDLGPYVCPAVQVTSVFWLCLIPLSSLVFVLAWLDVFYNGSGQLWHILGIAPYYLGVLWIRSKVTNEENEDLVTKSLYVLAFMVLAGIFSVFMNSMGWFSLAGVCFMLSLLTIAPYCYKNSTFRFWQTPKVGKFLPVLFCLALPFSYFSWEEILYGLSLAFGFVWLHLWMSVFYVVLSVYQYWEIILPVILCITSIVAIHVLISRYVVWYEKMIDEDNVKAVNGVVWLLKTGSFSVFIVLFLALSGFFATGKVDLTHNAFNLLIFVTPFAFLYIMSFMLLNMSYMIQRSIILRYYSLGSERFKYLLSGVRYDRFMSKEGKSLFTSILGRYYDIGGSSRVPCLKWVDVALRKAETLEQLGNINKFLYSDLLYVVPLEVDAKLLDLLLKGELDIDSITEAKKRIEAREVQKTTISEEWIAKRESAFYFIVNLPIIRRLLLVSKWIWSFVKGLGHVLLNLWYAFSGSNKFCAQTPKDQSKMIK